MGWAWVSTWDTAGPLTEKAGRRVKVVAWSAIGCFSHGFLVDVMDCCARAILLKSRLRNIPPYPLMNDVSQSVWTEEEEYTLVYSDWWQSNEQQVRKEPAGYKEWSRREDQGADQLIGGARWRRWPRFQKEGEVQYRHHEEAQIGNSRKSSMEKGQPEQDLQMSHGSQRQSLGPQP